MVVVLVACLALAVPVVVTLAASPSTGGPAAAPSSAANPSAGIRGPEAGDEPGDESGETDHSAPKGKGNSGNVGGFDGGFGNDGGRGRITITAISGSSVSLKTDDGWVRTITITPQTTITKGGVTIAAADLKAGDVIRFHEVRAADGTYSVDRITVPTPQTGGVVSAVASGSLTITDRGGATQTIVLTPKTAYTLGQSIGSRADVKVGSRVEIEGSVDGTTFTALTVHVELAHLDGTVTKKTATEITIAQRDGTTSTIHVSGSTTYSAKGAAAAALAGVAVGDRVSADGTLRADGSLDAVAVHARPAHGEKKTKTEGPAAASPAP